MSLGNDVIAQIITTFIAFTIFAFLAKKLFWKPLLDMIDQRQSKIKSDFDKIEEMQHQVNQMQADYAKRLADVEAEARVKIQDAIAQGRKVAEEIAEQARAEAEANRIKAEQNIAIEIDKARAELRGEVIRMTLGATEKIIRKNLDDAQQRELVSNFVEELARR